MAASRTRQVPAQPSPSTASPRNRLRRRMKVGRVLLVLVMVAALARLTWIQTVEAPQLKAQADSQREFTEVIPASRGSILDRNGIPIAFSVEARKLGIQAQPLRELWEAERAKDDTLPTVEEKIDQIASGIHEVLGDDVDKKALVTLLHSDETFVYLVSNVDPEKAAEITKRFPEVSAERQSLREYASGSLAGNIVGTTGWDGHGIIGLENSQDRLLAGQDGSRTYDQSPSGRVIPGSRRAETAVTDGQAITLTIDSNIQTFVQQEIQRAKDETGALGASAVVLDVRTGQVLAMANDNTFNPAERPDTQQEEGKILGNPAVTDPFEPGSVNKIITATAAVETGKTTPDRVYSVPGSINLDGLTVKDAWEHGNMAYTTTGIFGKSSNVGTLMIAQDVGRETYADFLGRFGLGSPTGIELPGESGGIVPELANWQPGAFANLPIGQGLSMTLLQMTSIYQTIANDGVRIPPRIIASTGEGADREVTQQPEGVRVVSPETARTVRDIFRAVVQNDPSGRQQGTGPQAAIANYQVSGKTGTAQKIDPNTMAYSNSDYWITFAGLAPTEDPRYVIGIMLDNPKRGPQSAAPQFHNIMSWLLNYGNVPLSPDAGPRLVLDAG